MRVFVFIIVFFSFFDLFTQLPIMSPFAKSLGAKPLLIGLIVGIYSLSNTVGNVLSGFLTDKKGAFRIVVAGLLLTGLSLFGYRLAEDAYTLMAVRFIHGLVAGLIVPAAFTYLANAASDKNKGKSAAISGAFIGMAAVIGPAFSGIVASRTSEVTVLSFTAFCMLLLALIAFFLLRKQPSLHPQAVSKQTLPIRLLFQKTNVVKSFIGAFMLMFSQGVLAYMLPLKVTALGWDAQTSGMLLSTFGMTSILFFLLPTNRLFDRVKPAWTLGMGMTAMGVSLILLSQLNSASLLYLCMNLYGIGFALLFPSLNSLLVDAIEPAHRGKAYGYFYAFFSLGVVVGSGITGLFALTPVQGFLFTGILLIMAAGGSLLKDPPVLKEKQFY
ncbi:MFS transporter [Bacillus xiapuensis]|uniref:MFS transporter n=1 Tax=Bacillus xiapuensis TaxID=2014075 RepID=UPI000C24FDD4|nr:MFS transporter [Bacillus xiapuensis]